MINSSLVTLIAAKYSSFLLLGKFSGFIAYHFIRLKIFDSHSEVRFCSLGKT